MKKILILLLGLFLVFPQLVKADQFQADYNIKVISVIALNNTTAIPIKATAGTVYAVDGFNNGSSVVYLKLYNSPNAICGQGTPYARYLMPFGASSSGGGFNVSVTNGDAYFSGITMCITGAIADNDTTSPPASTIIVNVHYK